MTRISIAISTIVVGSFLACGGGAPAPATPAAADPSAAAAVSAAPAAGTAWSDEMTKDQKIAYMTTKVAPRLGKVFRTADTQHYADFGCKTCHGPNYKDPKEFLPKLTFKEGKPTAFTDKPEIAKFMAEKVVPEMASALGKAPFDPATKKGFGCAGCHAVEMK